MQFLLNLYNAIPVNERRLLRDAAVGGVTALTYALATNQSGFLPDTFTVGDLTVPIAAPVMFLAMYFWRHMRKGTPGLRS